MDAPTATSTMRIAGHRRHKVRLLQEGDLVGGRFRVEGHLGEGGMGVVVAARHVEFGHRVAIKYLRPEACWRPDLVARFRWEGRATLQLRSEHAVQITDAGMLPGRVPYFVMELLEGMDLGQLLARRGSPLGIGEAIDYLLQGCEAVAEAHAMGIVHRDLKPKNLFITKRADGTPLLKVIDFGISSGIDLDIGSRPTNRADMMGSPGYMAPEQVASFEDVDARADVWSLGAVLYELLTGHIVHGDGSHLVFPARGYRAELPESLEEVVLGCLERDPDRRIQTVVELAQALSPFAVQRDLSAQATRAAG
jgi:eukaryotic-like serine/threonine-protein kinase